MKYYKDLVDSYNHALDRIYQLYKFGRKKEIELEKKLEIAENKLKKIKKEMK